MASSSNNQLHDGIGNNNDELTPLQKHVMFFDINKDGIIYPWETYQGFRKLGRNVFRSLLAAVLIHVVTSGKTRPQKWSLAEVKGENKKEFHFGKEQGSSKRRTMGQAPECPSINFFNNYSIQGKWPSLLFPIVIKNIKFGKHGSDSDAYDSEGRFVPEKFEEIFKKYAHTNPEYLTSEEVDELLKKNREPKDYFGWLNAMTDWKILFSVGKNDDGILTKEAVRNVYDGTLFEQKAREVAAKKSKVN